ncbi:hypothetical protein [Rhizobium sp. IY2]|uniref:hypothetical protein n=1 Tax=Rhizobium sp. IY2 TaxID=3397853 RepID=UPI0039E15020
MVLQSSREGESMSGSGRRRSSGSSQVKVSTTKGKAAGGAGGGALGSYDPCALEFDVNLSGIIVATLPTLSIGMSMSVDLTTSNGFDVVVCLTPANAIVGSLAAFPGLSDLIGCLRSGRRYVAQVTAVSGFTVSVHVEPKP